MASEFEPRSKDVGNFLAELGNRNRRKITDLERAQLSKVWIKPELLGTWEFAPLPETQFRYRLFGKDNLQTIGTLEPGVSGTVAYELLPPFGFFLEGNIHWPGVVINTGTYTPATFSVDADTLEVTITY